MNRGSALTTSLPPAAETNTDTQLPSILEQIAEQEARLAERFYEIFFERRPDALPLFGVHAISEREEMIRETLRSLFAWGEGETWLDSNLDALGRSHWEYGVTSDMYESFIEAMLSCCQELLGDSLDQERTQEFRVALTAVCTRMQSAGEAAESAAQN